MGGALLRRTAHAVALQKCLACAGAVALVVALESAFGWTLCGGLGALLIPSRAKKNPFFLSSASPEGGPYRGAESWLCHGP